MFGVSYTYFPNTAFSILNTSLVLISSICSYKSIFATRLDTIVIGLRKYLHYFESYFIKLHYIDKNVSNRSSGC